MSRSYKRVKPRKHFVYSVDDLMKLYEVTRNTVSNWVKEGLRPSDGSVPYVFGGEDVQRFHDAKRFTSSAPLRKGEFKCFGCRGRVFPELQSLTLNRTASEGYGVMGRCPDCDRVITKRVDESDCDRISDCINTNTSLTTLDEDIGLSEAGIGNDRPLGAGDRYCGNDRVIHDWLQYAGRWDGKTIAAKLAAVREFEAFCGKKTFAKVAQADVVAFRDDLKSRVECASEKPLRVSSVRHRASHLKDFFNWIVEQKGYQHLGRALPSYFDLPKRFLAGALSPEERPVPTLDEAVAMIEGMSGRTLKERRDRAMVALAFLGALRADTISSLRVGHLRRSEGLIVQDASRSRTKNGKSLRVKFFPLPAIFLETAAAWKQELLDLGFKDHDALFPDEKHLKFQAGSSAIRTVPVMSSTHAITAAFKVASEHLGKSFSPHSAKHCIGQLGWKVCDTPEQHKAWSMNMGHEDERVTMRHYKALTEDRVFDIFEEFGTSAAGETLEDKELMLRFHDCELVPDTPEWHRAKRLKQERSDRRERQTGRA